MKRSEANKILKLRTDFSTLFGCFSTVDTDPYFSRRGCDCCNSQACEVYDVVCLRVEDTCSGKFDNVYEFGVCGGCLCSVINGDDSDLDYYVDDEDVA